MVAQSEDQTADHQKINFLHWKIDSCNLLFSRPPHSRGGAQQQNFLLSFSSLLPIYLICHLSFEYKTKKPRFTKAPVMKSRKRVGTKGKQLGGVTEKKAQSSHFFFQNLARSSLNVLFAWTTMFLLLLLLLLRVHADEDREVTTARAEAWSAVLLAAAHRINVN